MQPYVKILYILKNMYNKGLKGDNMGISSLIALLGGVALFLFGMNLMGEGLKKVAGNKLEITLWKLTNNPIKGVLLGTIVTAIIQSSSATTVIVVGFVNSGMMKVAQAISIILGANIGTSITGWILCLSYIDGGGGSLASLLSTATLSALIAIIGILFRNFSKSETKKYIGDIMLGFSVLMYGMQSMSAAVAPLKSMPEFTDILTKFSNPFLSILIGILVTAVLQSASASVGILQALTVTGAIDFSVAFPIIMGMGIGAAAPVLLSSISANTNGRRTAFIYLFNDLIGTFVIANVFYVVNVFVHFDFMDWQMTPVTVAMINTVFRATTMLIIFPFIKYMEKLVTWLFKEKPDEAEERVEMDKLDERFLPNAALAIDTSKQVVDSMGEKTRKNLNRAVELVTNYKEEDFEKINLKEDTIDKYEDKLGSYLVRITGNTMNDVQSRQVSLMLHVIGDFERIGDHALNIAETAKEINDKKIEFSEEAKKELAVLSGAVCEIMDLAIETFEKKDIYTAGRVEPLEEMVDFLCDELKMRHISRVQSGICSLSQGFAFNDLITSYERISDHCSNIAVAVIEEETSMWEAHEYLNHVKSVKDNNFTRYFNEYKQKYTI